MRGAVQFKRRYRGRIRDTKLALGCPIAMKTFESWYLRVADSDLTWYGFNWMRPAKGRRLGLGYIVFSSVVLGLPGVALGIGAIYLFLGRVEVKTCLAVFALATMFELLLHAPFAHYWNKRAAALAKGQ
jgi:hypothetical protein